MVVVVGAGELEEEMRMAEQLRALATFFSSYGDDQVSSVERFCVDVLIPWVLCLST